MCASLMFWPLHHMRRSVLSFMFSLVYSGNFESFNIILSSPGRPYQIWLIPVFQSILIFFFVIINKYDTRPIRGGGSGHHYPNNKLTSSNYRPQTYFNNPFTTTTQLLWKSLALRTPTLVNRSMNLKPNRIYTNCEGEEDD